MRPALAAGIARTGRNPRVPIAGYVITSVAQDGDRARRAAAAQRLERMAMAGTPGEARDQLPAFHGLYDRRLCYIPSYGLSAGEIGERVGAAVDTFGGD